jgi:Uma2 family endonuclease
MVARPNRIVITVEDYLEMPDDGNRYEVYEGEIHQMPPSPNLAHQRIVTNLTFVLVGHVRRLRLGEVLVAPFDVILDDLTVVQPDLVFISSERRGILLRQHVRGVPDLVVEVISPWSVQRDREIKAQLYARFGVPHYWLIDPERGEAIAYQLREGAYHQVAAAHGDGTFVAPPFRDLEIPLTDLWD